MYADLAEVVAETRLHERARGIIEWLSRRIEDSAEHRLHSGFQGSHWSAERRRRTRLNCWRRLSANDLIGNGISLGFNRIVGCSDAEFSPYDTWQEDFSKRSKVRGL